MKRYHEELKELSSKLYQYPVGYGCGLCEECDDMYKTFMKIIKKIKRKQKAGEMK